MAKWIDKPGLSAGQLADGDKVLIGDVSEAVGERDKTSTLGALREFLGAGVTVGVTQASHGLSVGDVVRHNGTSYVAATADTASNAEAVGVVTSVPDTDSFVYQATGLVTGLSGLTPGEVYHLQDAGGLGTSPGTVEKPVLIAVSSTSGVMVLAVGASGGASAFTDLSDTPASYAGAGGKLVAVTVGADGLEFVDPPNAPDLTGLLPKLATVNSYAGNRTLDGDDSGAYVRITAAGTVTLPDGLATGFQCVIVNATASAEVALSAATTLVIPTGFEAKVQNRRAVTVIHVGSNAWEAHGALEETP